MRWTGEYLALPATLQSDDPGIRAAAAEIVPPDLVDRLAEVVIAWTRNAGHAGPDLERGEPRGAEAHLFLGPELQRAARNKRWRDQHILVATHGRNPRHREWARSILQANLAQLTPRQRVAFDLADGTANDRLEQAFPRGRRSAHHGGVATTLAALIDATSTADGGERLQEMLAQLEGLREAVPAAERPLLHQEIGFAVWETLEALPDGEAHVVAALCQAGSRGVAGSEHVRYLLACQNVSLRRGVPLRVLQYADDAEPLPDRFDDWTGWSVERWRLWFERGEGRTFAVSEDRGRPVVNCVPQATAATRLEDGLAHVARHHLVA